MSNQKINEYGTNYWYNEVGELHREDGPAVEYSDGDHLWWLNGREYTEEEYALLQFVKKGINIYV